MKSNDLVPPLFTLNDQNDQVAVNSLTINADLGDSKYVRLTNEEFSLHLRPK